MPIKCECGLLYVPDDPEDKTYHEKWHAEYINGPEIDFVNSLHSISKIESYSVYVVDKNCPVDIRRELSHVASVARRSMTSYPAGYDGTVDEDDQRLYIAASGVRIVGMVITALEDYFWKCSWDETGSVKFWNQPPEKRRNYKVARAWTAPSCQGKGLASQLVKIVIEHLSCNIADLGWELPLSKPGANLVKRFCNDHFWGCGDSITIRNCLR